MSTGGQSARRLPVGSGSATVPGAAAAEPVLAGGADAGLNLALVNVLPGPLAPGSAGPDIPVWIWIPKTVLRVVVLGAPLLMPLSLPSFSSNGSWQVWYPLAGLVLICLV
jgi:hypothetical protein